MSRPESAVSKSGAGDARVSHSYPPEVIHLMKPRRRLLFVFAFIVALWLGMMIVMYFGTVYTQRHPASLPAPILAPATSR